MNTRDEAEDHRLDWALGEKLGGETPPDLATGIIACHQRGDAARVQQVMATLTRPPARRWLAAALLLLGIGVVFAVALREHPSPAPDQPALIGPLPQQQAPATVHSVTDVEKLPVTTRAVIVRDCGDDVATALLRLRDLQDLEWHVSDREVFGLGLKVARPAPSPSIWHSGLDTICKLSKLRRLVLSGTYAVRPAGPDTWGIFDELQKLPQLQELALRFFDVPDNGGVGCFDVLPKLAALRRLDLSFNHGFQQRGIDILLQCTGLEALSLRGCQQLHGSWLAKLGQLPQLRELDVSLIDGINWRNMPGEELDPLIATTLFGARETARLPGTGVTDEALVGIARCSTLRKLDLSNSRFTDAGATVLADLTQLEDLELFGNSLHDGIAADLPWTLRSLGVCSDNLTDAFCSAVRQRLQWLVHLDVSACYGIHDAGVAELVAMPSLRQLEIRQMYGLTAASIAHFLKATQLEELDLRHCDFVTAQHVVALRRALPNLRTLQTNVPEEAVQAVDKLPAAVQVRSKADIEALPADTRNVEATGIGDGSMPSFERLREMERLVITQDGIDTLMPVPANGQLPAWVSIGNLSLRYLAKLPRLRILTLRGQTRFTGDGLQYLVDIPLEELTCDTLAEAELIRLSRLPKLRRLHLVWHGLLEERIVRAVAACTGLRELSLSGYGGLTTLQPLQQLRELEVLKVGPPLLHEFRPAGQVSEQGQALILDQPMTLDWIDALSGELASLTGLRQLFLAGQPVTAVHLEHLRKLPALETLSLADDAALCDEDLLRLSPTLTSITLRHCPKLTDRAGEILAATLPNLRTLDIIQCDGLTDAAFTGLLQIHSLKHLDLSYCQGFTQSAAAALAAAYVPGAIPTTTKLESLTVRGWKFDAGGMQMLRKLPFLQTLVTDAGTEQLKK